MLEYLAHRPGKDTLDALKEMLVNTLLEIKLVFLVLHERVDNRLSQALGIPVGAWQFNGKDIIRTLPLLLIPRDVTNAILFAERIRERLHSRLLPKVDFSFMLAQTLEHCLRVVRSRLEFVDRVFFDEFSEKRLASVAIIAVLSVDPLIDHA